MCVCVCVLTRVVKARAHFAAAYDYYGSHSVFPITIRLPELLHEWLIIYNLISGIHYLTFYCRYFAVYCIQWLRFVIRF